jgi:hypothetical protein
MSMNNNTAGISGRQKLRLLAWLSLPTLVLAVAAVAATFVHVETRARIDLVVRQVSFVIRGQQSHNLLAGSRAFSSLTIEGCRSVSLAPVYFARMDLVPAPAPLTTPAGSSVTFSCGDSTAKIALQSNRRDSAP